MGKNRVWVVSELYYPEETGTGHFMTKIAEGLAKEFSVKVLCGQPSYSNRGIHAPSREQYNGVDIIRCFSTTLNKDILIQRIVNLITISMSIFVRGLRSFRKGDIVLVVTNPPLLPYITMLACRLCGVRCIIRVDDVYPEVMVAAGMMRRQSTLFRILNWLTSQMYHRAECVIVLGRDMKALVLGKMSRNQDKVQIITNWADLDIVSPSPKESNALLQELGLTHKFVVQWAGNMGHPHEVKSLFDAMVKLQDYSDVHFLFIGSGYKQQWLQKQVAESGIENVTILGNRPRSDQQNFLNACDIALSSFVLGMSGIGVPSRTYNIMAVGKPILAIGEPNSELAFVIGEERIGWLVPPGQPNQLVQTILQARDNPVLLSEMGKRGRVAVEAKYSSELVISRYIELVRNLDKD